ncbi:MAG: RNA 2',3'-cyclic phosphodiesterase, partial [Eggerthellaceae bacterium]|nr:RNA 2',3'-cyclic phosphodiesterase [Eggerthellaceae bacterium]
MAVPLEDEEDFEFLASCSERLMRYSASGSFVRLANFHVTLIYIGESDRVEEIIPIMDETLAGFEPFNLVLDHTGKFARGKSSTVWVGGSSPKLAAIYEALWKALDDAGFELEKRKYTPHITLARNVVFASGGNGSSRGRRNEEGGGESSARK